eukprot:c12346_g1_i1.p1 GENE.c12346_g1_i1~~c12346_g1_i1.p1  ORF type:complete len:203 (+),score=60.89 c12346_g1_i1:182-790(+)
MMEDQKTRLQLPSLAVNWCKMCFGFGSQTQQHRPHGSIHSHYEIGRVLGSGRFGQVRLGKDRNTGQLVAIKIVKTEKQGPRRNFDVIKREVEALKRLEHPNIARFIATFEEHEYDTTTIPPPPTPTSTTTTSNANNNDNNTPTPSRSKPTPTPTTQHQREMPSPRFRSNTQTQQEEQQGKLKNKKNRCVENRAQRKEPVCFV